MASQAQRPAAGVGQDFGHFAIETGANQPTVMQAGDQGAVFKQQCLRPLNTGDPDAFDTFETLIIGVQSAGQGGRRWRRPGHRLHLGRHQQHVGADGHDHQQHDMTKLDGSTHAVTPVEARC